MPRKRETEISPEMARAGRISKAYLHEPILVVKSPNNPTTKRWSAVLQSSDRHMVGSPVVGCMPPRPRPQFQYQTTARKIMDQYASDNPGSSLGTPHIARFIQDGNLAFQDPDMRLQPKGVAFRLVRDTEMTDVHVDGRPVEDFGTMDLLNRFTKELPLPSKTDTTLKPLDEARKAMAYAVELARDVGASDAMVRTMFDEEMLS